LAVHAEFGLLVPIEQEWLFAFGGLEEQRPGIEIDGQDQTCAFIGLGRRAQATLRVRQDASTSRPRMISREADGFILVRFST